MAITIAFGEGYDGFDSAGDVTPAVNTTGYTHVAVYGISDAPAETLTFSDNAGSGAPNYFAQQSDGSSYTSRAAWWKLGSVGAGFQITLGHTGSPTARAIAFVLINATSGEIAVDASAFANGSGTAVDAGSLATTGASVVSVLFVAINHASTGNTEGSGWTEVVDTNENFGARQIVAIRGPETTTPIDPTYTLANTGPWGAHSISFREASAGSAAASIAVILQNYRNMGLMQ